jgi:glycosyltransferase involved in cell wall biosynthesis
MKKLAFVVPRFGDGFMGGAESLCGALAEKLAARGDKVEILTTCAKDNRTWENAYPAGVEQWRGLTVRRFPVDDRCLDQWVPLQIQISQGKAISVSDQLVWMEHSVVSSELFSWIVHNSNQYDSLVFAPYLFGTTYWGSLIHPSKSILIPCLHDESYAYLEILAHMFRTVRGCIFNAKGEADLCHRLYGKIEGGVVGMGFDVESNLILSDERAYPRPYLLYLGRKETGKNAHLLIDLFLWYRKQAGAADIDLIIVGGGDYADLHRPVHSSIVDMPHVSEERKQHLLRDAVALVQPSVNESFSIVLMEAWRMGTPVLVHGSCAVTRDHVEASKGGLYFADEIDFYAAINELVNNKTLAKSLAASGREYVSSFFSWDAVLQRFDDVYGDLLLTENQVV